MSDAIRCKHNYSALNTVVMKDKSLIPDNISDIAMQLAPLYLVHKVTWDKFNISMLAVVSAKVTYLAVLSQTS